MVCLISDLVCSLNCLIHWQTHCTNRSLKECCQFVTGQLTRKWKRLPLTRAASHSWNYWQTPVQTKSLTAAITTNKIITTKTMTETNTAITLHHWREVHPRLISLLSVYVTKANVYCKKRVFWWQRAWQARIRRHRHCKRVTTSKRPRLF